MITAKQIASKCNTTKQAKAIFKDLCKEMDRAKAQDLIKKACEIINANNQRAKEDNDNARAWLKNYSNILKAVFVDYVKSPEFKKASKGMRFHGSCTDFVNLYYPYLTKPSADGVRCPVVVRYESVGGWRIKRYRKMALNRASVFAVLDTCTKSFYKIRIGQFKQVLF